MFSQLVLCRLCMYTTSFFSWSAMPDSYMNVFLICFKAYSSRVPFLRTWNTSANAPDPSSPMILNESRQYTSYLSGADLFFRNDREVGSMFFTSSSRGLDIRPRSDIAIIIFVQDW